MPSSPTIRRPKPSSLRICPKPATNAATRATRSPRRPTTSSPSTPSGNGMGPMWPARMQRAGHIPHRSDTCPEIRQARIMKSHRFWLALPLACAMGASLADVQHQAQAAAPRAAQLPIEGNLPAIDGAVEWLNSPPLTSAALRGKVVLIEFWTYTCVNWRRTLPYLRAWAERYNSLGLVVIGVHTPEFGIEKDVASIRQAATAMKIDYPIAIDSDYRIWNAFNNQYWPALYFIDAKGHIRHHQFGEGDYQRSELVIQQLLAEAGSKDVPTDLT